jgi:cyclase
MSQLQSKSSATHRLVMMVWMPALACLGLILAWSTSVSSQTRQGSPRKVVWPPVLSAPAPGDVQILPVQGNVFMLVGAGANITVQAGHEGMLLVDTGLASMSDKVLAAMKTISNRPLRYIVNTTHFDDHTGGNAAIAATGEMVAARQALDDAHRASVISFLTVFHRMAGATGHAPTPAAGWPDNTYSTPQKRVYLNDEPVVIIHQTANTDGNSVVLFRKSDVVSAGDLLDLTGYPRIDIEAGGSLQAIVQSLNGLIDITVPAASAEGGTLVVPGHGRIADLAEVVYYRDMTSIIRDRIQDMIKRKMTLAEVKAAGPTRDWDARYGNNTGPWTTEMFVEAAYRNLSR